MAVTVVLLHNDSLYNVTLDMGQEISIGSHKKDDIKIADFAPEQILIKWKASGIGVHAQKAYNFDKDIVPLDTIMMLNPITRTALYISSMASQSSEKITLPYNCMLKFGRSDAIKK